MQRLPNHSGPSPNLIWQSTLGNKFLVLFLFWEVLTFKFNVFVWWFRGNRTCLFNLQTYYLIRKKLIKTRSHFWDWKTAIVKIKLEEILLLWDSLKLVISYHHERLFVMKFHWQSGIIIWDATANFTLNRKLCKQEEPTCFPSVLRKHSRRSLL